MVADISIHDNKNENYHVHIILIMRPFKIGRARKEYILNKSGEKVKLVKFIKKWKRNLTLVE